MSDLEKKYNSYLNHRDRLLMDLVADDFPEVMRKLRQTVKNFCIKNTSFKDRAVVDFKISF